MATNDERREVARRLRELAGGYVTVGELESALGICLSSPEVDLERDARDLHRMADLIEPETECTCRVESGQESGHNRDTVQIESPAVQNAPECDREALLALADEMTVEKGDIWGWSSRIRKALGGGAMKGKTITCPACGGLVTAETEMSSAGFCIDFSCDQCGEWIDVRADDVFAEAMEYFRGRRGAEEE